MHSVLILDNCQIHHNDALVDLVHAAGCLILYLPAYSPDFNPIEELFSACMQSICLLFNTFLLLALVKAYLHCNGCVIWWELDPIVALIEACGCIKAHNARTWFKNAGYIR